MKRDEEDVKKLIRCFSSELMINPFNANTESLVNFATGVVLPEEVADALLASRSKGQEQMKTFVKKRIQTNEVSYWDAIPKLGIKTFSSMTKKVKVKAGDEKSITVHADRDLFGRLLIVANARQINLMEVLSYELSPIPCSLAHQDGSLRKNTKSHLVWDALSDQLSNKLQKLQNRAARVILKANYGTSSGLLLEIKGNNRTEMTTTFAKSV